MEEQNVLFSKIRFISENDKFFGIGYLIFIPNPKKHSVKVHYMNTIASRFKFLLNDEFNLNLFTDIAFFALESKIREIKKSQNYNMTMSNLLYRELEKLFLNQEEALDIYELFLKKKHNELSYKLQYGFKHSLNINEMHFDFISSHNNLDTIHLALESITDSEEKSLKMQQANFKNEIESIQKKYHREFQLIEIGFSIAPISGVLIQNIQIGDILLCYKVDDIKKQSSAALLDFSKRESLHFMVEEILKGPQGQFFFIGRILKDTYGFTIEIQNVYVKLSSFSKEQFLKEVLLLENVNLKNIELHKSEKKISVFSISNSILIIFILGLILLILITLYYS